MTAAHTSCHWPAAAPFMEHGQHDGRCPPLSGFKKDYMAMIRQQFVKI